MSERRVSPSEAMLAYIRAKAAEIDAMPFARWSFDVHHGQLRRARVERTDDFGSAGDERLTA